MIRTGNFHDKNENDSRWKKLEDGSIDQAGIDGQVMDDEKAPSAVTGSPRLASDVDALARLMQETEPPNVSLRSKTAVTVVFGFGDASGSGLGSTFTSGAGFSFRIGVSGSFDQDESSNWKEFTNVVQSLEEEGKAGYLANTELFMFTDKNSTVESCSFRGSSSSPKLLDLIIQLRVVSKTTGAKLNIFDIAGTPMIVLGTNGVYLSRVPRPGRHGWQIHVRLYTHPPTRHRKIPGARTLGSLVKRGGLHSLFEKGRIDLRAATLGELELYFCQDFASWRYQIGLPSHRLSC